MGQTKSLVVLAGTALCLSGAAFGQQQTSDEVKAQIAQVMSDAESRTSLLSGGDAGHADDHFFIAGDGFRLNIGGLLQFRYYLNFRNKNDLPAGQFDDFTHGFSNRRIKVDLNGDLYKDWFFRVRLNADNDSSFGVDYAYAGYRFANGWKAQWGQFRLPLLREELVSDGKQLAVDRSIPDAVFGQGYSQGIQFEYDAESWRTMLAFSDGLNSANTPYNSRQSINPGATPVAVLSPSGQAEYAFTGRGEFLFSGNWKQFDEFTSPKGSDFGFMLGVAAHYQMSDNTQNPADTDLWNFRYTVDGSFKGDSWNAYAAFIGDHAKARAGGVDSSAFDNFGGIAQFGWRFAENTEIFGRWEGLFLDSDLISGKKKFNFVTAGINQYYAGHAAKATADVIYSLQDNSTLSAVTNVINTVGLLGQTKSGEVVIRLQFQVMF